MIGKGFYNPVTGQRVFVQGAGTTCKEIKNSIALGELTTASGKNQFVFGKANVADIEDFFAEIVGGGEITEGVVTTAKNIRTLDWEGNQWNAGDVTCDDGEGNTISLREVAGREPGSNKADKVSGAVSGDFAGLDNTGNLIDTGKKASDFATANHSHAEYALEQHRHVPAEVDGVIPEYVECDGTTIDLDVLVTEEWGMKRLCIHNIAPGGQTFGINDVLISYNSLPVHINTNSIVPIPNDYYVIVTVYKIDKNLHEVGEHPHDLCYFITLDGIFDNGNI